MFVLDTKRPPFLKRLNRALLTRTPESTRTAADAHSPAGEAWRPRTPPILPDPAPARFDRYA